MTGLRFMLNSAARKTRFPTSSIARSPVARFAFSIRTRSGVLIENLSIPGTSVDDAERKLRQIYIGCSVIARFVPDPGADVAELQRGA
jgi:hypothetical protein